MLFLRVLLFTILVPAGVTVWIPIFGLRLQQGPRLAALEDIHRLGFVLISLGVAIYLWCAWDFASSGRGTPGPYDPPRYLVARGLYRYVRNPMYIGVECVLLGEAILFASSGLLVYAVLVGVLFHLFVLAYEEPSLRRKFGSEYEAYCRRVPRWLPRLTPVPKSR
jgi:protein-S-isoprenylcysteine O-methyltransferase Ste14